MNNLIELLESRNHWLLLEPPGSGPLLHLPLAPGREVVLVEDGLQPGAPFAELQGLGDVADADAVEGDETGAVPVDGGHVEDASAETVELPVVVPGPGKGTAPLPSLVQPQGHLLQRLHDEAHIEGAE